KHSSYGVYCRLGSLQSSTEAEPEDIFFSQSYPNEKNSLPVDVLLQLGNEDTFDKNPQQSARKHPHHDAFQTKMEKTDVVTKENRYMDIRRSLEAASQDSLGKSYKKGIRDMGSYSTPHWRDGNTARIVADKAYCPACGVKFQREDPQAAGFVPKMARKENSPTEWNVDLGVSSLPEDDLREAIGEDSHEDVPKESKKQLICQRCSSLLAMDKIERTQRIGWSGHDTFSPPQFQRIVEKLRSKRCIFLLVTDFFNFEVLPDLQKLVGVNPLIVAVNKVDLLPHDFKQTRVIQWMYDSFRQFKLKQFKPADIFLVSFLSGAGTSLLLNVLGNMARTQKRDIYVIGAANTGKSTLMNYILSAPSINKNVRGESRSRKPKVTVSGIPGTTLNTVKIDVGQKFQLFDTPGLILPGNLLSMLEPDELRAVLPRYSLQVVSLMMPCKKQALLLGGFAVVQVTAGSPCVCTLFLSKHVKIHPTKCASVDTMRRKLIGKSLQPPYSEQRLNELGKLKTSDFQIEGNTLKKSVVDIVILGLGWFSVALNGTTTVEVAAPAKVKVYSREPLLPYVNKRSAKYYTGSHFV
ncbi:Nitric-oxide synthase, partial [Cardiosporidium cionae]